MLFSKLKNLGHDVKIYSSTPKFKFKNEELKRNIVFIPMFFQIIKKILGYNLRPWMKQFDNFVFDKITSLIMRKADILYGFAGCSLLCGKKIKKNGGKYYLDRACPHIEFQNNILINDFPLSGREWDSLVMQSKFSKSEEYEYLGSERWFGFSKNKLGHICLQDHPGKAYFKNIYLKELN